MSGYLFVIFFFGWYVVLNVVYQYAAGNNLESRIVEEELTGRRHERLLVRSGLLQVVAIDVPLIVAPWLLGMPVKVGFALAGALLGRGLQCAVRARFADPKANELISVRRAASEQIVYALPISLGAALPVLLSLNGM